MGGASAGRWHHPENRGLTGPWCPSGCNEKAPCLRHYSSCDRRSRPSFQSSPVSPPFDVSAFRAARDSPPTPWAPAQIKRPCSIEGTEPAFSISEPWVKVPVFWLPGRPPPALPIQREPNSGFAGLVTGYSGGSATDSHRVPKALRPNRGEHSTARSLAQAK